MTKSLHLCLAICALSTAAAEKPRDSPAALSAPAVAAINALGIDLLAAYPQESTLLSPYSVQIALAMTYAGAAGETRAQMAKTLHYPDAADIHPAFASLLQQLNAARVKSEKTAAASKESGGPSEPITLAVANRLFGQQGYAFRPAFLTFLKDQYEAPLEQLDFQKDAPAATKHINTWVEEQTHERIRDLIPKPLKGATLVLVNAIYLKAPWAAEFPENNTLPEPFHAPTGTIRVPTMSQESTLGYEKTDSYTAVTVPYVGGDLQLLIFLPEKADGLPDLEKKLTPDLLSKSANLLEQKIILHLPKFKLQPPLFELARTLEKLGMPSAFNKPIGSANFDGIAPRLPDDYLYISDVFHKTFIEIDEKGTEAAAATAVVMMRYTMAPQKEPDPPIVRIDRPFLFAIQHRPTGACLFLGRMTNPSH